MFLCSGATVEEEEELSLDKTVEQIHWQLLNTRALKY